MANINYSAGASVYRSPGSFRDRIANRRPTASILNRTRGSKGGGGNQQNYVGGGIARGFGTMATNALNNMDWNSIGGGTGGGLVEEDPYSQWGGTEAYNRLVSGFDRQKSNIFSSADDAAATGARGLHANILDFIDSYGKAQRGVDNRGIQNELAKRQGTGGILDMVGRGIRSGGVMLNNKNASDSSASGAIARAYGDVGRRGMSDVNNQYALENREIGFLQDDLGGQLSNFNRDYGDEKSNMVDGIVSEAQNSLAALDAAMTDADLPTRIEIEAEKRNIRESAMQKLSQYDDYLASESGKIAPKTTEQRRSEAIKLQMAGSGASGGGDMFNFTDEVPMSFQDSGPFPTDLPIFTFGRQRTRRA